MQSEKEVRSEGDHPGCAALHMIETPALEHFDGEGELEPRLLNLAVLWRVVGSGSVRCNAMDCGFSSQLISSRLVSPHLVSSLLISSRLVSSHLVSSLHVSSHLISSCHAQLTAAVGAGCGLLDAVSRGM